MSKPRKLPSGNWNIRVMVNGKSYSFTDPDKRTVKRMAAAFADQCREDLFDQLTYEEKHDYIVVDGRKYIRKLWEADNK